MKKKLYDLKSRVHAKLLATAALVGSSALAGTAMAADAAPDVSGPVSTINAAGVAGASIGTAVLSMYFGIKLYKWIKAAG